MKKAITILMAAALMLSLAACGGGSGGNVTPTATPTAQTETTPDETPDETTELTLEPVEETTPIPQQSEVISLDFAEITLESVGVSEQIKISVTSSSWTSSLDEEDAQAVYLMFKIKNVSRETIDSWGYFVGTVTVDGYSYKIENLSGINGIELAPLKSADYAAYAQIPNELLETGEPIVFNLGFNDMFVSDWNSEFSTCEHQYSYTVIKNGDNYELLRADTDSGAVAAASGADDAPTLPEAVVNETLTSEATANMGHLWEKSYYIDEFNLPTDEAFVVNTTYLIGTFSNSATTDSNLFVNILVDKENIGIMLYEYGRNLVKNSSNNYDEEYDIRMKTADGTIIDMKGYIWPGGDRIIVDVMYRDDVTTALSAAPVDDVAFVSFYIVQTDRPTTTYLFLAPMSNFAGAYLSLS